MLEGVPEGAVDVRRVVELDQLRSRLDDLGLVHPFARVVVEVAGARAERSVGSDGEVVGVLVAHLQARQHLLALPLFRFDLSISGYQFIEKVAWVPQWGLNYHLGMDGISLLMVLLSVLSPQP